MDAKMVIVARRDIKLGAGKLAAQVAHAAVSCVEKARRYDPRGLERWMDEGQKKVVVKVDGLDDLLEVKADAERRGLTNALIKDAGHTQLPPGTVTCLGIGPGDESDIDAVTGHLALY